MTFETAKKAIELVDSMVKVVPDKSNTKLSTANVGDDTTINILNILYFFVNQSIRLFEVNDNVCTNIQRRFNTNCNFIVDYFLRYWYKEARWRAC
mmetsp:Transcript_22203/g.28509  ORF Transcript_22203/g.28509 Transcript_22203/m.28509 type:complete len:95 (-) Transcript_22203:23-307(-)